MIDINKLKRLWINDSSAEENIHSVVFFRRRFTLEKALEDACIILAADSDFILYIDGIELERGQYSDDPLRKSFTQIKLPALAAGEHILAVKVYYCGSDFSTYSPGLPGLYIALQGSGFYLEGDKDFKVCFDPAFRRGTCEKITVQLGFSTCYDLQKQISWTDLTYDDSTWQSVMVLERSSDCITLMRPEIARARMREFVPAKLYACGSRGKSPYDKSNLTAAEKISYSCCYRNTHVPQLPCTLSNLPFYGPVSDGIYLIADLGYEETGFVEFELDAPAGTVIYYAHGEHIDDGHVRSSLYSRNFADTVIWQGGRHVFQLPFRRVGARYLELHIEFPNGGYSIELYRIGIIPWRVELPEAGVFECSSDELNTLHKNSLHTLQLCMHDHYEDCPWREQALYTYDSRWQMIYGYYSWGNYDFAAASMELFVPGQLPDGHLRLCAPTRSKRQIPTFTLVWLNAVYEQYLFSGSKELFERNRACAERIKDLIFSRFDAESGLLKEDEGSFWHFYEWRENLNGQDETAGKGFSSLYNIYSAAALEAYAALAEDAECKMFAAGLKKRIHEYFYQSGSGLYASRIVDGKVAGNYHEHTQALMLLYDVAPANLQKTLAEKILTHQCGVSASLSSLYLCVNALEKSGVAAADIIKFVLPHYEPMLANNTGTLWETSAGADDFGYAGSLCHGWSALPIYLGKALILGIKNQAPGWQNVLIAPQACGMTFAKGAVPTPYGNIEASFTSDGSKIKTLKVRCPKAITCSIVAPDAVIETEYYQ